MKLWSRRNRSSIKEIPHSDSSYSLKSSSTTLHEESEYDGTMFKAGWLNRLAGPLEDMDLRLTRAELRGALFSVYRTSYNVRCFDPTSDSESQLSAGESMDVSYREDTYPHPDLKTDKSGSVIGGSLEALCHTVLFHREDSVAINLLLELPLLGEFTVVWRKFNEYGLIFNRHIRDTSYELDSLLTRRMALVVKTVIDVMPGFLLVEDCLSALVSLLDTLSNYSDVVSSELKQSLVEKQASLNKLTCFTRAEACSDFNLFQDMDLLSRQVHYVNLQFNKEWCPQLDYSLLYEKQPHLKLNPLVFDNNDNLHHLGRMFVTKLFKASSPQERANVVVWWVELGSKFEKIGDMVSWLAIATVVCSIPILRMSQTWFYVPQTMVKLVFKDWVPTIIQLERRKVSAKATNSVFILAPPQLGTAYAKEDVIPYFGDLVVKAGDIKFLDKKIQRTKNAFQKWEQRLEATINQHEFVEDTCSCDELYSWMRFHLDSAPMNIENVMALSLRTEPAGVVISRPMVSSVRKEHESLIRVYSDLVFQETGEVSAKPQEDFFNMVDIEYTNRVNVSLFAGSLDRLLDVLVLTSSVFSSLVSTSKYQKGPLDSVKLSMDNDLYTDVFFHFYKGFASTTQVLEGLIRRFVNAGSGAASIAKVIEGSQHEFPNWDMKADDPEPKFVAQIQTGVMEALLVLVKDHYEDFTTSLANNKMFLDILKIIDQESSNWDDGMLKLFQQLKNTYQKNLYRPLRWVTPTLHFRKTTTKDEQFPEDVDDYLADLDGVVAGVLSRVTVADWIAVYHSLDGHSSRPFGLPSKAPANVEQVVSLYHSMVAFFTYMVSNPNISFNERVANCQFMLKMMSRAGENTFIGQTLIAAATSSESKLFEGAWRECVGNHTIKDLADFVHMEENENLVPSVGELLKIMIGKPENFNKCYEVYDACCALAGCEAPPLDRDHHLFKIIEIDSEYTKRVKEVALQEWKQHKLVRIGIFTERRTVTGVPGAENQKPVVSSVAPTPSATQLPRRASVQPMRKIGGFFKRPFSFSASQPLSPDIMTPVPVAALPDYYNVTSKPIIVIKTFDIKMCHPVAGNELFFTMVTDANQHYIFQATSAEDCVNWCHMVNQSKKQSYRSYKFRMSRRIFGVPIEEVCQREGDNVPHVLNMLLDEIDSRGLDEIGLYRVPGSVGSINALKQSLEEGTVLSLGELEVNTVAGCFKLYLRELPQSLFCDQVVKLVALVNNLKLGKLDQQGYDDELVSILKELPQCNYHTMKRIFQHLHKVHMVPQNKMDNTNLAIVFSMSFIDHDDMMGPALGALQNVVSNLIANVDKYFA